MAFIGHTAACRRGPIPAAIAELPNGHPERSPASHRNSQGVLGFGALVLGCTQVPPHIPLNSDVDGRDARYVARRRSEPEIVLANSQRLPLPSDEAFVRRSEALRGSLFPSDSRDRRDDIFYERNRRLQAQFTAAEMRGNRDQNFSAQQEALRRQRNLSPEMRADRDQNFAAQQEALKGLRSLSMEQRRELELQFLEQQERLKQQTRPRLTLEQRAALFQATARPPPGGQAGRMGGNDASFMAQQQIMREGYDEHQRRTAQGF